MKQVRIERNRYFDSVFLMRISAQLEALPDTNQAIVAMATPVNVGSMKSAGFRLPEGIPTPNDLMIAVDAATQTGLDTALARLDEMLAGSASVDRDSPKPTSLAEASDANPGANVVLISVPGRYAAREARRALERGLHVMLFSDNVSVENEIALKDKAVGRGLLMMGPDCGTAILNGAPLGFANAVRRGRIGLVGASGTGIQEISTRVHALGGGISQAIGTGGRDLSEAVDGRMTRFAIDALAEEPETDVIVVVSKAPGRAVAPKVLERLEAAGKPGVVCFVGWHPAEERVSFAGEAIQRARTLAEAAERACVAGGIDVRAGDDAAPSEEEAVANGRRIVGLFCGGTLCQEAWSLMRSAGIAVSSNVAFDPVHKVAAGTSVAGHVLWDLGDDAFTVGKPHPMIEPALRDAHVAAAGEDVPVAVVLVDCVIGYGAHADPAASLAQAIAEARRAARAAGRTPPVVIGSVIGTERDPQNANRQRATLQAAGMQVAASNAQAVRWAIRAVKGGAGE